MHDGYTVLGGLVIMHFLSLALLDKKHYIL